MAIGTPPPKGTLGRRIQILVEGAESSNLDRIERYLIRQGLKIIEVIEQPELNEEVYAVILTATKDEYQAVYKHLDPESIEPSAPDGVGIYEKGQFQVNAESRLMVLGQIGPGSENAAVETTAVIYLFKPRFVLFVGTAGGVKLKDVKLGDVVIAELVYNYESGVYDQSTGELDEFLTRPRIRNSDRYLIGLARYCENYDTWKQRIKEHTEDNDPDVHIGSIAAGAKLFKSTLSQAWYTINKTYDDTLAVEQEGYGFLLAASRDKNVAAIVIRGISDLIVDKDAAEEWGSKKIAMANASAFAFELIANSVTIR
jgi:nucleoside phosphorylase